MTTSPLPATVTIGSVQIRQHNGLYSLNDLHKASGSDAKHKPHRFIRLDTTQALIAELSKSPDMGFYSPAEISNSSDVKNYQPAEMAKGANLHFILQTTRGRHASTYACRELVIAYAAWISAEFHLKVIRVFLESVTPAQAQPLPPAPPEPHKTLSPAVAQEIAAEASRSILDALQRQNLLVDWAHVTDALTDKNSEITLYELTDLIHACLKRLQRSVDSEAYTTLARRAARQGVCTTQVSLNA